MTGSGGRRQHVPKLVHAVAEQPRDIEIVGRCPRADERLQLGERRDHAGELLSFLEQPVDEGVEGDVVRGLREHEVERVRAERRSGDLVPVGDDPEVERLVEVRSLDQGGRDPQEQVVAGLVTQKVRGHGLPEGEGVVEAACEHGPTVAQRRRGSRWPRSTDVRVHVSCH